ncbi:aminopeptidase N [Acaricomes phytoseiuli]|uniref:aminopeptidase N n=1 Tax=Acaricomes phytoseiuli TaxID=291968 RepID=UPI0022215D56|nr:aminopeptidase N [Acaricomes phytoseiuli]MCW1250298.1 aminopeptidase N [Acaricomes phytoseiuli]
MSDSSAPVSPSSRARNLSRAEAAERARLITVRGYTVSLDLRTAVDSPDAGFSSRTVIDLEAAGGSDTFVDFIGHSVECVTLNGVELDSGAIAYDGARIQLSGLHERNQVIIEATAAYSRSGEGLHRFVDPEDGKIYLYTQYEPADARRVFANFEQPDLKATYRFDVIAPQEWQVASNGAEESRSETPGEASLNHWHFAQTEPISSYITCVIAGQYAKFESSWSGPTHPEGIALAAYCRSSAAEKFDAEAIFELTRKGLDYFHGAFQYPYPFGKYDQAFVPEYNLGAMENPGLVTFTDDYVFTSRGTDAQYQQRANTLLHEMAHMWFGDLVTMRWWDDLWLKESFADYMGTRAVADATDWAEASWVAFANRRKAWAYSQDQLPTTHPIVADIVDLEAAKQNFDGITYAKGASVLKQLVAYVGSEAFFSAARTYFRQHAFGNTTLDDFLTVLSEASGRDMSDWARRWLRNSGISTLSLEIQADGNSMQRVRVRQEALDPVTDEKAFRPHRLNLGCYDDDGQGGLVRTASIPVEVDGEWTEVPELAGARRPAVLLLNDDDLSYAKIRLDAGSLGELLGNEPPGLSALQDPLARALCWSALWNLCRDGILPAADYMAAVSRHAAEETDVSVLSGLLENALSALEHYAPQQGREALRKQFISTLIEQLEAAEPGSDAQLAWARGLAASGLPGAEAGRDALVPKLHQLLAAEGPEGLVVDTDLRWRILGSLAALGNMGRSELEQQLSHDRGSVAATGLQLALEARPLAEAKAEAWRSVLGSVLTEDSSTNRLSNDEISARLSGFRAGPSRLREEYDDQYFDLLETIWEQHSIEIASRIIKELFPGEDARAGLAAEDHRLPQRATSWLAQHPQAPGGLRRIILEGQDQALRDLRAQLAVIDATG